MKTILSLLLALASEHALGLPLEGDKPAVGSVERQLAIAVASALMVRENGKDPSEWKEVSAISNCYAPPLQEPNVAIQPRPLNGEESKPRAVGRCGWNVYFATRSSPIECPDGSILKEVSGDAIHFYSLDDYRFFRWFRQPICEERKR